MVSDSYPPKLWVISVSNLYAASFYEAATFLSSSFRFFSSSDFLRKPNVSLGSSFFLPMYSAWLPAPRPIKSSSSSMSSALVYLGITRFLGTADCGCSLA